MNDYFVAVYHQYRTEQLQQGIERRDGSRARAARIRRRAASRTTR